MKPLGPSDPPLVGSFRLLGVLGGGGMGRVYLGQSPSGRRVAVKVVRAELADDPTFRLRFSREVTAARAANPLYTAAVVDADPDAIEPWLATAFIDGPSLEQQVSEHGPLSPGVTLVLAAGLAEALSSIHRVGLVHRDLKPSNVLLDDTGPHIIDFGIALAADDTRMTTSVLLGTPSYLAPERVDGEVNPSGDVFALGATLAFAATGKPLVNGETLLTQVMQIAIGRFSLETLPVELRPLVLRCLSHYPKDRPTPAELVRILMASGVPTPAPGWYLADTPAPVIAIEPPVADPAVGQRDEPRGARHGRRTPGSSRRQLLVWAGATALVAVGGSVAAGVFDRDPRAGATPPGPYGKRSGPGSVLWQARSGTIGRPPNNQGVRVIVDRGQRVIAMNGGEVFAIDVLGNRVWGKTLSTDTLRLHRSGETVLVTDTQRVWLLDAATGKVRLGINAARDELAASGSGQSTVLVRTAAAGAGQTLLTVGTALIALGPDGRLRWRTGQAVQPAGSDLTAENLTADQTFVVTQEVADPVAQVGLYEAATGDRRWSIRYQLSPPPMNESESADTPDGDAPPPGPPPDDPPPGDPPRGEARGRRPPTGPHSEALIGPDHLVLLDTRDLRAVRIADGKVIWHKLSPTPVAEIALFGDLLLVAADTLAAYHLATGSPAWQVNLRGARLAVSTDQQTLIALVDLGERSVSALNPDGTTRWQAALPDTVTEGRADGVTMDDHAAYLTFRQPPGRQPPLPIDVLAISLD